MMNSHPVLHQSKAFATALDADEFEVVRKLLSIDCIYTFEEGILVGTDAILDFFRANSQRARVLLDEVVYESEIVEVRADSSVILFIDRLKYRGFEHTYRSQEKLFFGKDYVIKRIEHKEIRGERENLEKFLDQCGIDLG